MFIWIFFAVTGFKILLMPAYYSTDFEVHRNWMAITHNLPLSKWYYENSSEWTLDYPPFFGYFEWILSQFGNVVDPQMIKIENVNYNSTKTVIYQRSTVIASDIVYAMGVRMSLRALNYNYGTRFNLGSTLLLANVGLLLVDHIHFQYNGFLCGILLISMSLALKRRFLLSALFFTILINMKHIFLYVAPVFCVFYLKFYCWESKKPLISFLKLVLVGLSIFSISFGPFYQHIPQILSRLFPFKRGLMHANWAPNFWALYNTADKLIAILKGKSDFSGKWTSGLVQNYSHDMLPSVTPFVTVVLTVTFMIPCLVKLLFFTSPRNCYRDFIRSVVVCTLTSFMFGWHVHEKAILIVIIPLSLLTLLDYLDAKCGFILWFAGHWSLHPLLFKPDLLLIKYPLLFAFQFGCFEAMRTMYSHFKLNIFENLYIFACIPLILYQEVLQYYIYNLSEKLPFLPLLLTSLYCSVGILYFYINFYIIFLRGKSCNRQSQTKEKETKSAIAVSKNKQKQKSKKTKVQ
ncbi:probable dolichyl pyrophosphate Glc1Man9GlcNAc2 alpha-1,3-glucosyltransferase [Condylostylus longicornis]|uniref:probable dolichyl pyrophosphate Glc1Man9GlcNAc2 alpha-1,3-glucosyltransferase n=1 Tax=Condylostylus longicornis TaxID=2530218 RepID=UPI00244DD2D8|nr:probable dolichyl pyrophosphate Glc1Man9GlcNAc2 alpha-1,3-glucosyltransferase [Condylostylus longicornis]